MSLAGDFFIMRQDKWTLYSQKFSEQASRGDFSPEEIDSLLNYAKILYERQVPIIYDQEHLGLLVGYKYKFLLKISNKSEKFYRSFKIPKKSGGEREISEPLPSLKEIQRWILDEILYKCSVSRYAKAYIHKRSIRDNARFHLNQKNVLAIDIKDFFPSLHFEKIYGFFVNLGYSVPVATMLSNLCSLNGGLPQGAPTSPALSNILMLKVDKQISGFIKENDIHYTRYADDMTFSGDFNPAKVIRFVRSVLDEEGLRINEKKTRVRNPGQRQEVTGVIVNEKMQASREMRKKLRQAVYYIEKYGLASHLEKTENFRANHIYHLLGISNFILFLNPEDKDVQKYREILRQYIPAQTES
jgi:RNA-directed DNA polymerase